MCVSPHDTRTARSDSCKPFRALSGCAVRTQNFSAQGSNGEEKNEVLGGARSSMATPVSTTRRCANSPFLPRTDPMSRAGNKRSNEGMARVEIRAKGEE